MKISVKNKFKSGGVSIFVVAITALIVSVMVLGFMRLMNRDNAQSSQVDISQSAYDSAQAGVEDAKRFLETYIVKCADGVAGYTYCDSMKQALEAQEKSCYMLASGGYGTNGEETKIETTFSGGTNNDNKLSQAYTCVKIYRQTDDYLAELPASKSRNIMLRGTEPFNKVKISWYSDKDLADSTNKNLNLRRVMALGDGSLIEKLFVENNNYAGANQNVPPVVRAQFMGVSNVPSGKYSLWSSDMDSNFSDDGVGFDQRIYYPSAGGNGAISEDRLPTTRRAVDSGATPRAVECRDDIYAGGYACSVEVDLGHVVNPDHVAMLKLTSLYTGASYKVELKNNNSIVKFDGVQPKVDSTGRANDAFRRVESRIEFSDPNFPSSDFTVYTEDKLCKKFWTTNTRSGSVNDLECR